jgi:DNA-binding SARP family transcriptional activator
MRFSLLGPLVVADSAGGRVTIAGPRLRVLLAALLLHANMPVPASVLAEMVWDGSPPPGAVTTLRSYVRRLRAAVDPGAARIAASGAGYVIRVELAELDVLEFEGLCRDARAALRAGEWAEASAAAVRALGLWRAAPLLDVPGEALRGEFVPRFERLRLQVLEDRFDAGLRLGQHQELIPQLLEVTVRHPLQERFHVQLMPALAGTGRRAQALRAYRQAREVLVDELGIEPGGELRDIHLQILAGDAAEQASRSEGIEPDEVPGPALTGAPVGMAGFTGRERHAAHLNEDRAPLAGELGIEPAWSGGSRLARAQWRPLFQLPAAPADFTGRRAECELILGALAQDDVVPAVAIFGQPGVGKTALALRRASGPSPFSRRPAVGTAGRCVGSSP